MGRLVILAGGVSSRMKLPADSNIHLDEKLINDAEQKSKSMIRLGVGEKPFLNYLLRNAFSAGYEEIVIVVNEKDNSIIEYYSTKKNLIEFPELKISFAIQPIPDGRIKPMGTADALFHALSANPGWNGKKFSMCNSDNLYSVKAMKLLRESPSPNAMIDYDRDGLKFDIDRIAKFAVTKKDSENYLIDIIEKPDKNEIDSLKAVDGFVGVSMNIFMFSYDMVLPFLRNTPINPARAEKEIPTTVRMLIEQFPKSVFTYRLCEQVPDLSSKTDIPSVKEFLQNKFEVEN